MSDVDVIWLRNPTSFFNRHHEADLLISVDHLTPTVGDEPLMERYPEAADMFFNVGKSCKWYSATSPPPPCSGRLVNRLFVALGQSWNPLPI